MQTSQLTARWINASPDYQMKNYIPKNTETSFDNQFVNEESREVLKFHDIYNLRGPYNTQVPNAHVASRRTLKSSNHGANNTSQQVKKTRNERKFEQQ